MKPLYQYFFRGLFAILPVGLTVYVLFLFASWIDSIAMSVVRPIIGDFYLPGLGIALGVALIVGIGFVISQPYAARLMPWVELPFTNLPVVKSIYSSLKNFADFFSTQKKDSQQVVVLRKPGQELSIVGLVTRQDMRGLPVAMAQGDPVAVYLPMGYMIGGYTVFVPRSWIEPIEMSVEEAMRSTLIAWMASKPADAPQTAV
ncbi:MAG: DUF502 domain-containing protein [Rhodoferax sp.]|uniref:DUF502 domain-containing protein n=1 Tax=Rhodoferax sp. TaxID=50421 RepID=UPI0013FFC885|nr:DUF502 domain-containing protein [Rhodoferax sp.]NDP37578.1 DUF502 domain-containing protein [Rhodoferax sp.]